MDADALQDLADRLVGQRYYNTEIDESFTVIGLRHPFVLIQYDDGTGWDELSAPELLSEDNAKQLGMSEGGIDSAKYKPLNDGPALGQACADGVHTFYPRPSDLGIDDPSVWHSRRDGTLVETAYARSARCQKCGLSASVLSEFLGHEIPTVCDRCEEEALPSETDIVFSPTDDWMDAFLCGSCAAEVTDEEHGTQSGAAAEITLPDSPTQGDTILYDDGTVQLLLGNDMPGEPLRLDMALYSHDQFKHIIPGDPLHCTYADGSESASSITDLPDQYEQLFRDAAEQIQDAYVADPNFDQQVNGVCIQCSCDQHGLGPLFSDMFSWDPDYSG